MKPAAIFATAAILLAACGHDETADAEALEPRNSTSKPQPEPFLLNVTGAETIEFDATPLFGCVRDQIHIMTMTQAPRLDIYLPAGIGPGRYPLAEYDANADPRYVEGKAVVTFRGEVRPGSGSTYGNLYFKPVDGELVIERMPAGRGEFFTARVDVGLSDADGEAIQLTGDVDIKDSGSTSLDCQY